MQQLTRADILGSATRLDQSIQLALPLPSTPAAAIQLVKRVCTALDVTAEAPDWGADRMQVLMGNNAIRFLFSIEWLCEAIWLEPIVSDEHQLSILLLWLEYNK